MLLSRRHFLLTSLAAASVLAAYRTSFDRSGTRAAAITRIRLRIINGASSTNFRIEVGQLQGSIVAVDGNSVKPIQGPIP
jgi:hypothetical protein